jgi:hypothetical protein
VDLQRGSSKRSYMLIANGREQLVRFFQSSSACTPYFTDRIGTSLFHIITLLFGQLLGSDSIQIDSSPIVNVFLNPENTCKATDD